QLGESGAERAQRRAADLEADLGDAEVATTEQRHRALDAPRHQVGVRGLAVGEPEPAAEVPGRHVSTEGERLDVQRLRVLPVDPVADPAKPREVEQVLRRGGSGGHRGIMPGGGRKVSPLTLSLYTAPTPGPAPSAVPPIRDGVAAVSPVSRSARYTGTIEMRRTSRPTT